MAMFFPLRFGAVLAGAFVFSNAAASQILHVPAYDIPVPGTVSPEMQVAIARAPASNPPTSRPTTNAGWNALSNLDPAKTHALVLGLLHSYNLTLAEKTINGVHCFIVSPAEAQATANRFLMHLHGGGYTQGAGEVGVEEAILVAGASRIETVSVDYRMPPDYPFPAPVDDAMAVWKYIIEHQHTGKLGIFGSSTGGAMTLAVTQRAIREHLRIPDAIFAGTPWSDLSETGDSYFTNRYVDPMVYEGDLSISARQYANGHDLKEAELSPIYGSFADFPPTLLLTGTRDLFLSNTVRVDRKLRDAGRYSELIVYEGESHAAYFLDGDCPEMNTALRDISVFFARELK